MNEIHTLEKISTYIGYNYVLCLQVVQMLVTRRKIDKDLCGYFIYGTDFGVRMVETLKLVVI